MRIIIKCATGILSCIQEFETKMYSYSINCARHTGFSMISNACKKQLINQRSKKFFATSTVSMTNAKSGRAKDNLKVQGPSTVYRDPVRQVLISQSNDVFTNLALEDWLYKYHDFDHKVIYFSWKIVSSLLKNFLNLAIFTNIISLFVVVTSSLAKQSLCGDWSTSKSMDWG